nr:MAG TPA: putative lipoprotein [Caudoviricetes sp.]
MVMPSGRTLSQLVNESVASAYKQAGYEVVTEPGAADATSMKVHIVEFWSWFTPGFFSVDVSSKSLLRIETPGGGSAERCDPAKPEYAVGDGERLEEDHRGGSSGSVA